MKIIGRNIKRRLYRLRNISSDIARARYFRGHGVHSPFVYALVRQVFMRSTFITADNHPLYDTLLGHGVSKRRATELQNIMSHCDYDTYTINRVGGNLCIATRDACIEQMQRLVTESQTAGTTLCIMAPYDGRERQKFCKEIIEAHQSTSVDKRAYLLLFNNYLPKQHFRI